MRDVKKNGGKTVIFLYSWIFHSRERNGVERQGKGYWKVNFSDLFCNEVGFALQPR